MRLVIIYFVVHYFTRHITLLHHVFKFYELIIATVQLMKVHGPKHPVSLMKVCYDKLIKFEHI